MVCRCVVLFAVVLCAPCALGCRVVHFLSSPPYAVLLCGPLSLGALLPCAVPRGAVLPHGAVVSCPAALLGLFLAWMWLYLLEEPLQNFVKYFSLLFLAFENEIKLYTTQHTCGCHACKQSGSRDRGLISSLPIPYCTNYLLYVDFIHGLPRFSGYDSCLVVTCGLSRFTRVFPCNKNITGEQTVKMLIQQWLEPYRAPEQVHSDEDVRIRSDTGWYRRVLNALNVEVTTGVPYTRTSNPLCETQNRVVEQT